MVNPKFKDNLGSDLMITSKFGEYLIGFYLVKKGCFVVRANTEGCDLFVMNKKSLELIKRFYNKLPKLQDGRIDYSNSDEAPVITVIVKYEDEILLLKRSDKVWTYKGKWQVIAGYLDELKPLKEKVLAELREEAGITEKQIKKIKYGKMFEFRDNGIGKTWIVNPVLVELKEKPKIKIDFEHTDYRWIKPKEIEKLDIVPNLKESLKRVL